MEEDLVDLWSQLLLPLRRRVWYAFTPSDAFKCNLQSATSLNQFQYETILQASGILCKKGDNYTFSNSQLDYLQGVLRGRFLDIYINRSKIERNGKRLFFIAVDKPHQNPSAQAKDEPNIRPNRRGNHGLDAE